MLTSGLNSYKRAVILFHKELLALALFQSLTLNGNSHDYETRVDFSQEFIHLPNQG